MDRYKQTRKHLRLLKDAVSRARDQLHDEGNIEYVKRELETARHEFELACQSLAKSERAER